jgi:hypothetical protein
MKALFLSSDFWEKPAMGGSYYSNSLRSIFRHSKIIEELDEIVLAWPPISVWRRAKGLLASVAFGGSTFRNVCTSPELAELERDAFHGADLIIVNGSDQLRSIRRIPEERLVIYVMHNREFDYAKTSIAGLPRWQQWVLALTGEVARCVREEEEILRRASLVIGISRDELEAVGAQYPGLRTAWVPPVFGEPRVRSGPRPERLVIGMLGSLDHFPNRTAIEFLLREAWPHADPRIELVLAGKGTELLNDPAQRIVGMGHVPDLASFWEQIDVLAAPILQGAGTNVKVCEALANRVPLLATPFALRGLPPINDPSVWVASGAEEWRCALAWENLDALAVAQPSAELARLFSSDVARRNVAQALEHLD